MADEKKQLTKVEIPGVGVTDVRYRPVGGTLACWWSADGPPARLLVRAVFDDGSNKVWEYLPQHISGPVERSFA